MLQSSGRCAATLPSAEKKKRGGGAGFLAVFFFCFSFFKPSFADICQAAQEMKWDPCCAHVTVSEETGGAGECLNISTRRRQQQFGLRRHMRDALNASTPIKTSRLKSALVQSRQQPMAFGKSFRQPSAIPSPKWRNQPGDTSRHG